MVSLGNFSETKLNGTISCQSNWTRVKKKNFATLFKWCIVLSESQVYFEGEQPVGHTIQLRKVINKQFFVKKYEDISFSSTY